MGEWVSWGCGGVWGGEGGMCVAFGGVCVGIMCAGGWGVEGLGGGRGADMCTKWVGGEVRGLGRDGGENICAERGEGGGGVLAVCRGR